MKGASQECENCAMQGRYSRGVMGQVYFIRDEASSAVKIGWTANNVASRLSAIQTGNPNELTLLGVMDGDEATERDWHSRYVEDRIRGEWFSESDDLLAEINLRAQPCVPERHPHPLGRYLQDASLSQAAFALRASISRQTVWRILAGKGDYSLDTLRQVSRATDNEVTIPELLIAEQERGEAA